MTTDDTISDDTLFDKNRKKKGKKRITRDVQSEATVISDSTDHMTENEKLTDTVSAESDFTYEYLITRAFAMIGKDDDPPTRLILSPPEVGRVGAKRTSIKNFGTICRALHRPEKHLYEYFIVELGTTASIDVNHALIIKGRLNQIQIETLLRKFIKEYVICKTCRSSDTLLEKIERLTQLKCNTCHSKYTVSSIKTGYRAQLQRRT